MKLRSLFSALLLLASCASASPRLKTGMLQGDDPSIKFSYELSYPLLVGLENETVEMQVNQVVEQFVRSQIADRHADARRRSQRKAQDRFATSVQGQHQANLVKDNLFSTALIVRFLPNPRPEVFTFNFRLDTGKQVRLEDLWETDSNYLHIICRRVMDHVLDRFNLTDEDQIEYSDVESIESRFGPYGDSNEGTCTAPDGRFYQHFTLDRNGLLFLFSPCMIYRCDAGMIAVPVPYSALRGLELPNGPLAWVT
jgi:hypothetical protein